MTKKHIQLYRIERYLYILLVSILFIIPDSFAQENSRRCCGGNNQILTASQIGQVGDPIPLNSANKQNINADIAVVTFQQGDGVYAFDKGDEIYKKISKIKDDYEYLAQGKETYLVPWKFMPVGGSDKIQAKINIKAKNIDLAKVIFATPQGIRFKASYNEKNGVYTIDLAAGYESDIQEIYALYEESAESYKTLGKLNVITYSPQTNKLVVVQVNGYKIDESSLKEYLKKVYSPIAVTWEVRVEDYNYTGNTDGFFDKGSKLLSAYNEKMLALQNSYKSGSSSFDKAACYLFILNDSGDGKNQDTQGFMPRGKQFGYIFKKALSNGAINHNIAHELGHGRWRLEHTFDSSDGILKEGKTDPHNLMDYTKDGVYLAKWQWTRINNPAWFTNPFEGDESGMAKIQDGIHIKERAYYAMTGGLIADLENVTILPSCHFDNKNILYRFKDSQGKIWIADIYIDQTNPTITSYVNEKNGDETYPLRTHYLNSNEQVLKINYNSQTSELEIIKITFGNVNENVKGSSHSDIFINAGSYKETQVKAEDFYAKVIANNPCDNSSISDLEGVLTDLRTIQATSKLNQSFELEHWDSKAKKLRYYTLKSDKLVEVENPLSNEAILNGNWSDNSETKIRYTRIEGGVIQVKAMGFKQGIQLKGKELDTKALSQHVTAQTNAYLAKNNVKSFNSKPKSVETTEEFADGGRITIGGNNVSCTEILSSGSDFVLNLIKTGEVDEKNYLESTRKNEAIHAPGLVTGSFEVVAQKVTDLTSLGCLAYDLTVDESVRAEMYKQFKGIKDEIAEDPGSFLPVLGEVLLTVGTGNTTEDMKTIFDESADSGKRSHLGTRGTGNAIVTAMSGAALVKSLPQVGEKLTEWVKKIKNSRKVIREVLTTDAGRDYLRKYYNKFNPNFSQYTDFESWFKDAINYKFKDILNFEVHHIIPVNVLEKNPELQRIFHKFGFEGDKFNAIENAIPLQKKSLKDNITGHSSHKKYDDFIAEELNKITTRTDLTDIEKFELIQKRINDMKNKLEAEVLLGNKNVNDITSW